MLPITVVMDADVMRIYNKYPWPASAIDRETMSRLFEARRQTGIPINQLIKQAIDHHLTKKEGISQ